MKRPIINAKIVEASDEKKLIDAIVEGKENLPEDVAKNVMQALMKHAKPGQKIAIPPVVQEIEYLIDTEGKKYLILPSARADTGIFTPKHNGEEFLLQAKILYNPINRKIDRVQYRMAKKDLSRERTNEFLENVCQNVKTKMQENGTYSDPLKSIRDYKH